ncbi:DNA/RNA non-specific endonuclease [Mesorhizobium sp. LjNodule214]|uniref:DNA/RNA non-specific endonuclease n=1 Tax=Mesorhizobium sp. LjNodule214 TaxID=3342252 RepID=UPI003ECCA7A8
MSQERDQEMYKENGQIVVLKYHHFSLAMNASRRMQMWSAVNVDYDASKRTSSGRAFFGQDRWVFDPRIPQKYQLGDPDIYAPAKQIDRGHIVRREDNAWGDTPTEIEFANSDTFHFSNCTPQHAAFNRSQPGKQWPGVQGLWGGFENHIQRDLQSGDTRACIIAGPILNPNDPSEDFGTGPVQYPLVFWKVVAVSTRDTNGRRSLRTYGFRLSQKDVVDRFGVEFAPGEYVRYQVALSAISDEAGVIFDDVLLRADTHADA